MSTQIHEPGEGIRTIDIGGSITIAKADGATTGEAFAVAETTLLPGGFVPPLHLHREIAEALYVLSGRLDVQVGDDRRIAVPGTFVGIPAGVAHTMSVAGEEPVRMLMIVSNPARALEMIDTLERAFADGEPDPETAGRLLAQIDMEVLAPAAS
ncbi:MAG TPA: cupin domain-containing protein [Solirubrobacteraceae bacterium]|nr:cupin domain-containing protein [Solirubrobacteraceae bacterium]